jgi:hypothetical protein
MELFAKKNGEPTWFKPHRKNGSLSRNMGIGNQQLLIHFEKPLQESVGKKAPWIHGLSKRQIFCTSRTIGENTKHLNASPQWIIP